MATQSRIVLQVRLPRKVHENLKSAAADHGVSLNAEITERLAHSFGIEAQEFRTEVYRDMAEAIERRLAPDYLEAKIKEILKAEGWRK